jgi:hypothetical protein
MQVNQRATGLCQLPRDWDDTLIPERAIVQMKWDGLPMLWSEGQGLTREGEVFQATSRFWPALAEIERAMGEPMFFHAEYVNPHGFDAALGDYRRGWGDGLLMIFDAVPLACYRGHRPCPPLWQRLHRMIEHVDVPAARAAEIGATRHQTFTGEERDNIEIAAGIVWEQGHEGLVIKNADSPYTRARSADWMRLKRVETVDLRIVGTYTAGGIVRSIECITEGKVLVRVGVGFSAADRQRVSDFRPGKMVEVKHLGWTKNGSLRSPSFVRCRPDKVAGT